MREIKFKKIPMRTKIRWLFLGKWPLERKSKPKILEYMFLVFNNILIFILSIILLYIYLNSFKNTTKSPLNLLISLIQEHTELKLLITLLFGMFFVNLFLCIHVYYILSKTEFNKWIPILGTIFALSFVFSFLAILFFMVAYAKSELAFE
ncbi:hypothetical domain protein [Mycoplasmopsis glycophila]|uniref:Hypothetical domain protein n=1 Tax=Mycoplasmopsis glycophila TaxID=171285 RepID=A0A449AWH5_9BACT|nr:hypothetical domain protein [Mycoplasmopsis glycophila]